MPIGDSQKKDSGKPRTDLLPVIPILEEAEVLAFGAEKYSPNAWRSGMAWSRLYAAALRHLFAWYQGQDFDPETGLPHLAHARCCLSFLQEYRHTHPNLDDRPTACVDLTRPDPETFSDYVSPETLEVLRRQLVWPHVRGTEDSQRVNVRQLRDDGRTQDPPLRDAA